MQKLRRALRAWRAIRRFPEVTRKGVATAFKITPTIRRVGNFGYNPGNLRMFKYMPARGACRSCSGGRFAWLGPNRYQLCVWSRVDDPGRPMRIWSAFAAAEKIDQPAPIVQLVSAERRQAWSGRSGLDRANDQENGR